MINRCKVQNKHEGVDTVYKACIFDLDGTLADTLASLHDSVNQTLMQMGLSGISEEACRRFVGNGARYLMEQALTEAGAKTDRIDEAMAVYKKIFARNCHYKVTPYEGVVPMLHMLKKQGIKLGVLSNKPYDQAVDVVKALFGDTLFDYVQGQREDVPRKPHPDGIFLSAKMLAVPLEDCLYIGDSEVDVQTGRSACVRTIAVSWGFRTKEELKKAGACDMIDRPQQLHRYLRMEEQGRMGEYNEECLKVFLQKQEQLFDEPVAETLEEAEAFLEDCMAVIVDSLEEVKDYFEQEGADVEGMSLEELEEASEVFALPSGQYLIVEG